MIPRSAGEVRLGEVEARRRVAVIPGGALPTPARPAIVPWPRLRPAPGEVHRQRRLPVPGEVLVAVGQGVAPDTPVARALLPGRALAVPFAGMIGCEPAEAAARLTVREGQRVAAGEVLARAPGIWGLGAREARAPAAGTVERISAASGQLTLRGAAQPLDVVAHIPGVVTAVLPGEGAEIACRATAIAGVFGVGGEVRGTLALDPAPGAVWLLRAATTADLGRASAARCAAVLTGSAAHADLPESGMVVILTEGFGTLPMAEGTWAVLRRHLGAAVSADGTTRIRAGVVRPEVILPLGPGESPPPLASPAPTLGPGVRVRLVRDPGFGRLGRILQLPALPRPVASGAVVRVAVVALDGGGALTVPRANVEAVPW